MFWRSQLHILRFVVTNVSVHSSLFHFIDSCLELLRCLVVDFTSVPQRLRRVKCIMTCMIPTSLSSAGARSGAWGCQSKTPSSHYSSSSLQLLPSQLCRNRGQTLGWMLSRGAVAESVCQLREGKTSALEKKGKYSDHVLLRISGSVCRRDCPSGRSSVVYKDIDSVENSTCVYLGKASHLSSFLIVSLIILRSRVVDPVAIAKPNVMISISNQLSLLRGKSVLNTEENGLVDETSENLNVKKR